MESLKATLQSSLIDGRKPIHVNFYDPLRLFLELLQLYFSNTFAYEDPYCELMCGMKPLPFEDTFYSTISAILPMKTGSYSLNRDVSLHAFLADAIPQTPVQVGDYLYDYYAKPTDDNLFVFFKNLIFHWFLIDGRRLYLKTLEKSGLNRNVFQYIRIYPSIECYARLSTGIMSINNHTQNLYKLYKKVEKNIDYIKENIKYISVFRNLFVEQQANHLKNQIINSYRALPSSKSTTLTSEELFKFMIDSNQALNSFMKQNLPVMIESFIQTIHNINTINLPQMPQMPQMLLKITPILHYLRAFEACLSLFYIHHLLVIPKEQLPQYKRIIQTMLLTHQDTILKTVNDMLQKELDYHLLQLQQQQPYHPPGYQYGGSRFMKTKERVLLPGRKRASVVYLQPRRSKHGHVRNYKYVRVQNQWMLLSKAMGQHKKKSQQPQTKRAAKRP